MKLLKLESILQSIGGKLLCGQADMEIRDIATRTRRLRQNVLLFDLHRDGAEKPAGFPPQLRCAVVTDDPGRFSWLSGRCAVIQVSNAKKAFWKFVAYYRGLFDIPVIGVTGTCGKTTTKEMIRYLMSEKYRVKATYKSYNEQFRHLNYLLDIDGDTQAAVYEMGVAAPGDLTIACRFFKPQVGVITNIGVDHLRMFGTLDAYIRGKAEFLEGLGDKGTIIINADDENIKKIDFSKFKGKILTFGCDSHADFRISDVKYSGRGVRFRLDHSGKQYEMYVPGYGVFNACNAAAAIAAVYAVGMDIGKAGKRLRTFENVERHFQMKKGVNGSVVIDDTWSANPTSVEAALKLLKRLSYGRKTVAVLSRMSLLGKQSDKYHFEIGKKAAAIGIDRVIVIGNDAKQIGLGAIQGGLKPEAVRFCRNSKQAAAELSRILRRDVIVLIKTTMLASYGDLVDRITVKKESVIH